MKPLDHCAYPPRLSDDVEIVPQAGSTPARFIAGSVSAGRYLLLGEAERRVIDLLDGQRTPGELGYDSTILSRFLAKLDEVGMLAGHGSGQGPFGGNEIYLRWKLFNPERVFTRILPSLRWIWTRWFFVISLMFIAGTALMAVTNWAELSRFAGDTLREHYLALFFVAWLVAVTHEFAHGLTAKAFGGRATEVGALLVYYFLPALYCNVSGLHLIPQRGRRLWVIAAGIYWQSLLGAIALLAWLAATPGTLLASAAMILTLGSLLDVIFNANPLIKLDGYYFLSQWLRIPNLMDRSRACWSALLWGAEAPRCDARERQILLLFGFFSFLYNLALPVAIVWYAAQSLMDWLLFPGLLLSLALGAIYAWRPVKKMLANKEKAMIANKRWIAPVAIGLCLAGTLCMPWTASVGGYGSLVTIPGQEAIVHAPENGSLIALDVQPGERLSRGATLGRMGNLDLEEQIAQVRTDLARVNADAERLSGDLRVQQAASATVDWQLAQRRREFTDVDSEERQIQARIGSGGSVFVLASNSTQSELGLPAALAVLQAGADQLQARAAEANRQLARARTLFNERILARADLEAAEAKAAASASDLEGARERLSAALVDHRRRRDSAQTEMNIATTALAAGRAQTANLDLQIQSTRRLEATLEDRLALLERKRAQFALMAPVSGTAYGEDLPRAVGQYFVKGTEICRIAETRELLVRIQMAEQSLGDIAMGQAVRVKMRAFPDRVFHGVVSNIGGEGELDANGQRAYRVELTVHNQDGLLRPGMTVFARINFGRHAIAWLAAHKLKQALRPEMWML